MDLENILAEKISFIDKDLDNQVQIFFINYKITDIFVILSKTFHGFRLTRGNKDLDFYVSSVQGVDYYFNYIK